MNLIWVLVVAVLAWMVYMYMQSYESIAKELREIRVKCMQPQPNHASHPITTMKQQVETALQTIRPLPMKLRSNARPALARLKALRNGTI